MYPRTVFSVLEQAALTHADQPALHQPIPSKSKDTQYRTYTWAEYRDIVREIACGLRALGVRHGDIVALQSETRAEFYLADIGIMSAGAIAAALYTSLPYPEQLKTLRASEARWIFAENTKVVQALKKAAGDQPLNAQWVLLTGEAEGMMTLDQVREAGRNALAADPRAFDRIREQVAETDIAVLYMTSGATGEPKMGLVSHRNLVSNLEMGPYCLPLKANDCTIAFLPSAHIAQRVVVQLLPIISATQVYFSEGLSKLPNEFRTVRPTFFLAPPRVWERLYSSITTEIKKRGGITRRLFYAGLGVGSEVYRRKLAGESVPAWLQTSFKFFDKVVFTKIRERLGGRLRVAASGAAPLSKQLGEFFAAIGLPLVEGYGLTEGGVVSLNPIEAPKPGSIGKTLRGVEVRLAEDGELMVKSPCVFQGYYKDPESTALVLRDGWLATGDIAEFDQQGYIYITGRKKELIVSSNGKKIYPSRIEGLFKQEPLVSQVVLIGDRMPYVTALFTINTAAAETLKGMDQFKGKELSDVVQAPPVTAEIQRAVKEANQQLASFEQIRRFKILDHEFSIESGEMTPTMKIRRNKVLENYREAVNELYLGKEAD
jgi:long-chain acyl-CoA synthetase